MENITRIQEVKDNQENFGCVKFELLNTSSIPLFTGV